MSSSTPFTIDEAYTVVHLLQATCSFEGAQEERIAAIVFWLGKLNVRNTRSLKHLRGDDVKARRDLIEIVHRLNPKAESSLEWGYLKLLVELRAKCEEVMSKVECMNLVSRIEDVLKEEPPRAMPNPFDSKTAFEPSAIPGTIPRPRPSARQQSSSNSRSHYEERPGYSTPQENPFQPEADASAHQRDNLYTDPGLSPYASERQPLRPRPHRRPSVPLEQTRFASHPQPEPRAYRGTRWHGDRDSDSRARSRSCLRSKNTARERPQERPPNESLAYRSGVGTSASSKLFSKVNKWAVDVSKKAQASDWLVEDSSSPEASSDLRYEPRHKSRSRSGQAPSRSAREVHDDGDTYRDSGHVSRRRSHHRSRHRSRNGSRHAESRYESRHRCRHESRHEPHDEVWHESWRESRHETRDAFGQEYRSRSRYESHYEPDLESHRTRNEHETRAESGPARREKSRPRERTHPQGEILQPEQLSDDDYEREEAYREFHAARRRRKARRDRLGGLPAELENLEI